MGLVREPAKKLKPLKRIGTPDFQQHADSSLATEDIEIESREFESDMNYHRKVCSDVRQLMLEIKNAKDNNEEADTVEKKRVQTTLQFVTLKKLNRLAHLRCKKARDTTMVAKQRVDNLHLQVQNLLYEVMHIEREITKCREFKSTDEDIALVEVEDFYREAPHKIAKPDTTKNDKHKQRLARLDWELEQRKRLAKKFKECQSNTDIMIKEIQTKQEYIDSLQPRLEKILDCTKPVQDYLSMPFSEKRTQHQTARLLPRPLYILFVQGNAYREACDPSMALKIEGDTDAVRSTISVASLLDYESDSDNEESLSESKRRRKTVGNRLEEKRQKVLTKHPLQVTMTLAIKDGTTLNLTFSYLVVLQIVTVQIELKPGNTSGVSTSLASDLLSPKHLLTCLYPGDDGLESPNPTNEYQLSKIGMESLSAYINETGHPYRWAQWLAGLDFLPESPEEARPETSICASHMEDTVRALYDRVHARLAIQKQLASLERNSVPVPVQSMRLFPAKICTQLTTWKTITDGDIEGLHFTQDPSITELVEESHRQFLATCVRGSAKLQAVILLSLDYPSTPPHIIIGVTWYGDHNANNDHDIREMEEELNLHYQELTVNKAEDYLLANQVQRLMMCFDVYLETKTVGDEGTERPLEFAREKMYMRITRGRSRSRPYRYYPQQGYFTHR